MINEIFGYHFHNQNLLKNALTHPSLCAFQNHNESYERLELLGDAALSLVILELLVMKFPQEDEGKLAKRKAYLVAGEVLAQIAQQANISEKIVMSDAEAKSGGHHNPNNLENALEAIIGAIYLDGGLDKLKPIIASLWQHYINEMQEVPTDPKSQLQEILQARGKGLPQYKLIDSFGPKHMLTFRVSINVPGYGEVIGEGKSKQQAEKHAATLLLAQIND